ncbi:NAD(P)-dependent alcohol dehydrogenase [Aspergillus aculeatinus CBS 121060]|uniref:alcohol dehydrogenase (NADP(+)) n=3 Tax=Aspergillus TaxID=5052 RepID=A0A8G1RJX2_9EURO|nr:GroES-like protein [Aspergillus brunneoviolaceus CBS 621.78]XP_025502215.1 GroES-like protein [Aspergillus aculeatinus CBS 121060]XP_040798655.1 GroES-like protein [Aspergillus fijiensis CBS 313.89]RAH45271.1 GroES-like protein [Aspergillus brunneoviolaceus CBS 621.78]RAH68392.1 GroES-like protein [Aspergillus aculeatinus CBS 121060]RAK74645.1 GroES-like protein [Aspergillus fijiensis CBS 313.89]
MASTDYKFEGWMALEPKAAEGNMVWQEFEPKPWEETDIDIKITHCGICGSDMHTLRSGWGPTNYPCCVGHEIVGVAVRVGSKVEGGIKVGDRVGVGAQSESCMGRNGDCEACASGLEQYCPKSMVGTYNGVYANGGKSYGGYATYNRVPSRFAVKIPDAIPSAVAAPMLCGGITTYSPLKHFGCGPGKRVGIIGVGGLGHFGIMFAKALGADKVVAISRKGNKREDALKLGADAYIATDEDSEWAQKNSRSLDLIISTVSSSKMPITDYVQLLDRDGAFVQLGVPEDGSLSIPAPALIFKRVKFSGSLIGSPSEIGEMLQLAAEKNVRTWVEERPMKDANTAIVDMDAGKARFRYVLCNEQ